MTTLRPIPIITGAATLAAVALAALPAQAAGPFDGMWELNVLGAGSVTPEGKYECPPAHITFQVQDGKLSGTLERVYGNQVVDGYDRSATPVTGTVDKDGNVTTAWQGVTGTGHVAHNHIAMSFPKTDCGPRFGAGERY